jgi:hypothetical protein
MLTGRTRFLGRITINARVPEYYQPIFLRFFKQRVPQKGSSRFFNDPYAGSYLHNNRNFTVSVYGGISVAKHDNVVLLSIVNWYAHDFRVVAGFFKKMEKFLTSVLINVALFHGEAPFFYVFQLLCRRLILNSATGITPDGFKRGELHLQQIANGKLVVAKMYNNGPSYRVGEAPRAKLFGLARLPNICHSGPYQLC